jgi:hypothetical protein
LSNCKIEPRKSGKNDFEEMMKQYNDTISAVENDSHESSQTGALIFGVGFCQNLSTISSKKTL